MHLATPPTPTSKAGAVFLCAFVCLAGPAGAAEDAAASLDTLEYWLGPDPDAKTPLIWRASVGGEYSRYDGGGGANAWMGYAALSLTYGRWTVGVSGSYQQVDAMIILPDRSEPLHHDVEGFGDANLSLRYDMNESWTGPWLASVAGRVKIPSGSARKGLGSGKPDVTLSADVLRPLGVATVFFTGAHTWRGETDGLPRNNTWNAAAGADLRLSFRWNAGASYEWRALPLRGDTSNVYGYGRYRLNDTTAVTAYMIAGLDPLSPDYGAGLQISFIGVW